MFKIYFELLSLQHARTSKTSRKVANLAKADRNCRFLVFPNKRIDLASSCLVARKGIFLRLMMVAF